MLGVHGQKYPSRFFCSIEPSWSWSMRRVMRSECGRPHLLDDRADRAGPWSGPRRCTGSSRACGSGTSRSAASRPAAAGWRPRPGSAGGPAPPPRAPWRSTSARRGSSRARCRATRRARSSWRAGRRGCSRRGRCGRCRGSTAPGAGSSGPTGRARRGTNRCAPWRASSPRRGARRRYAVVLPGRSALSSPWVLSRPQHFTVPRSHGLVLACSASSCMYTRRSAPISRQKRSRNSYISGNLYEVSTCSSGKGILPGKNAFCARRTITRSPCRPNTASPAARTRRPPRA